MFGRRRLTPAEKVRKRLESIEHENEQSVRLDHRFGVIGVVTIALAAMLGMAYDSVQALLSGHLSSAAIVTFATVLVGVAVMQRSLLASARNIRRSEGRGEVVETRDRRTLYGVIAIESLSLGYLLWQFEQPSNLFQWLLLAGRAVAIPYATVFLEQQRRMPLDPLDISVETQIGQGMGVMEVLVTQSYDRDVPTALVVQNYRANADLSPALGARFDRMIDAAQAYEAYKQTGVVQILDARGEPVQASPVLVAAEPVRPSRPTLLKRPKARAKRPQTGQDERIAQITAMLHAGQNPSIAAIRRQFSISQGAAQADLLAARERARKSA